MTRLWILSLLLCATLTGVEDEPVRLQFAPRDGETTTLSFERVLELSLDHSEQEVTYDGEAVEGEDLDDGGLTMTETETISFSDEHVVKDGEWVGVTRRFSKIANLYETTYTDPDGEAFDDENLGTSELEETAVVFQRGSAEDEFSASFAEDFEDLDESLLEGLLAEANLSDFLPEAPVEVGENWEPELGAFINMSNFSGDLKVIPEGEEVAEDDFAEQFDENLEGKIEATLKELRSEDGSRLAWIVLSMELETRVVLESEFEEDGTSGSAKEEHRFEFSLEGGLLWNLSANRAHSLELSGDLQLDSVVDTSYSYDGHDMRIVENQELGGSLNFEATIE